MVDLAEHREDGFIALKDVAERQGISKKYLEQIVPVLNSAGFLLANRGNKGGYMLKDAPEKYKVGDVLRMTEGNLSSVSCLETGDNTCERKEACKTLFIWEGLDKAVKDYLDGITIGDILDRSLVKNGDYVI